MAVNPTFRNNAAHIIIHFYGQFFRSTWNEIPARKLLIQEWWLEVPMYYILNTWFQQLGTLYWSYLLFHSTAGAWNRDKWFISEHATKLNWITLYLQTNSKLLVRTVFSSTLQRKPEIMQVTKESGGPRKCCVKCLGVKWYNYVIFCTNISI